MPCLFCVSQYNFTSATYHVSSRGKEKVQNWWHLFQVAFNFQPKNLHKSFRLEVEFNLIEVELNFLGCNVQFVGQPELFQALML